MFYLKNYRKDFPPPESNQKRTIGRSYSSNIIGGKSFFYRLLELVNDAGCFLILSMGKNN
jgi:hypothetical protein